MVYAKLSFSLLLCSCTAIHCSAPQKPATPLAQPVSMNNAAANAKTNSEPLSAKPTLQSQKNSDQPSTQSVPPAASMQAAAAPTANASGAASAAALQNNPSTTTQTPAQQEDERVVASFLASLYMMKDGDFFDKSPKKWSGGGL